MKILVIVVLCIIQLFLIPVFGQPLQELEEEVIICGVGFDLVDNECVPEYPKDDDFHSLTQAADNFVQVNDFDTALELIKKAESLYDEPSIFFEKSMILAKMAKHQEALEAYETYKKVRPSEEEGKINYTLDTREAMILYHIGDYHKAHEVMIDTMLYVDERVEDDYYKTIMLIEPTLYLGMILEKLGEEELSKEVYDKVISIAIEKNLDCAKVESLINLGGYVEALEILNNMGTVECHKGNSSFLKEFVKERINLYVSPSFGEILDITCGKGTVENEYGQCIPIQATSQEQSKGGGCLIATAAYGSELASQVQMLREIRDNSLLQTQSGQSFIEGFNTFYYSLSPTIADYERQNPVFKEAVKMTITPLLTSLSLLNYVKMDSEQSVLVYGIGAILMNVGIYLVAPAVVIFKMRKLKI